MNRSAVREIQGIGRFKFREGELEEFNPGIGIQRAPW